MEKNAVIEASEAIRKSESKEVQEKIFNSVMGHISNAMDCGQREVTVYQGWLTNEYVNKIMELGFQVGVVYTAPENRKTQKIMWY